MTFKLKTKLTASYMLIILICVGIISLSSNIFFERQFRNYIIKKQEQDAKNIVTLINRQLKASGNVDSNFLYDIGMNAIDKGMIIKIKDNNDTVIWDANAINGSMCQQMMNGMQSNMQGYYSDDEGGYTEKSYDLINEDIIIGSVVVGYYGPYFYTDSDLYFIKTINNVLIIVGAISLLLAFILGLIMSKQLTKPISRVIKRAEDIAVGKFISEEKVVTSTSEIVHLSDTIEDMATTLKKQQDFSRQTSLDIAHELRTPLTTIQGNLEAMIDGVMELDQHRVKILHEEVLRINRLVDDLGKLSLYERDSFVLNKTKFDISNLISQIVKSFESDFTKANKKILFSSESIRINADKDKISQVIINLISNGLKYTLAGDVVEVILKKQDDYAQITIKDNGIGIAKEDLANIFERFYRVDKSRSRLSGGSGIGLTIAKSIVKAHGGSIEVQSELEKGCKFFVKIPRNL
jgi:two-component system, OmpR family, sensor histidine kinase BaeS